MPRHFFSKILLMVGLMTVFNAPVWSSCSKSDTRFASSSNTLYIEAPVICTLSDLAWFVSPNVLEQVDPIQRIWLLKAHLRIVGGGTLRLHGSAIGGDVDQLRLLSSNNPAKHIRINARWGNIDIRSTRIQSWDSVSAGPDTDTTNGRAYINAESYLDTDGATPRESRMDIIDSEVNHLGYDAAVAYGLAWKVVGDFSAIPDLYDRVNVYGSLVNSYVHDNRMGYYSFGALGIQITDNEVAYNELYGIDPHDDSDQLVIQRNVVHDNGSHGIICSRRCDNLTITDNEVYRSQHGIMLHREVTDSLVANNYVHDNRDTGIALFESHTNKIQNNIVEFNQQGIRLSLGSHDNVIENNTVRNNTDNGLYLYMGSDPPETTDGRPKDNVFRNNLVADNGRLIKVRDSDRIQFTGNIFSGSVSDIEISDSSMIDIVGNIDQVTSMGISSKGAISGASEVRFETDRDVLAEVDEVGVITLTNPLGRILSPVEPSSEIVIEAQGSKVVLTRLVQSSASVVTALPLYATTSLGSYVMTEPLWSPGTSTWYARTTEAIQNVQFRLAQLGVNTSYSVYRDESLIKTITSDNAGGLSFSDALTPGEYYYRVSPN